MLFESEIYLEDTDCFGVAYHANYMKFFERGRIYWLKQQGVSLAAIHKSKHKLLVTEINIKYHKPLYLGDKFNITTEVEKQKLSLTCFKQMITNQQGETIAQAQVKVVALDSSNKLCHIAKIIPLAKTN